MKQIHIIVPEDLDADFAAAAKADGLSKSEAGRLLVARYVAAAKTLPARPSAIDQLIIAAA